MKGGPTRLNRRTLRPGGGSSYWGYFIVILAGSALMVLCRAIRHIYNCDPDLFDEVLARVLDKCSLYHVRVGRKVFIGSARNDGDNSPPCRSRPVQRPETRSQ